MGEAKRRNKPKPPHPKRPRLPGQAVTVPIMAGNKDLSEDMVVRTTDGRLLLITRFLIPDIYHLTHREVVVVDIDLYGENLPLDEFQEIVKKVGLNILDITESHKPLTLLDLYTIPAMKIGEVTFKIITTPKPKKEKKLK